MECIIVFYINLYWKNCFVWCLFHITSKILNYAHYTSFYCILLNLFWTLCLRTEKQVIKTYPHCTNWVWKNLHPVTKHTSNWLQKYCFSLKLIRYNNKEKFVSNVNQNDSSQKFINTKNTDDKTFADRWYNRTSW